MTLREQIEALTPFRNSLISRRDVLDIIAAHKCYDRDGLARALHETAKQANTPEDHYIEVNAEQIADDIMAALKEQENETLV